MRRLLAEPPKEVRHELIGRLTRATLNLTDEYEPFTFVPRQPYFCPVCGAESDGEDRASTVLALEFENGEQVNLMAWTHRKCFETCEETEEPDEDLESH